MSEVRSGSSVEEDGAHPPSVNAAAPEGDPSGESAPSILLSVELSVRVCVRSDVVEDDTQFIEEDADGYTPSHTHTHTHTHELTLPSPHHRRRHGS